MKTIRNLMLIFSVALVSCGGEPVITDSMVDSGKVYDLAGYPAENLMSVRFPNPIQAQKNTPVIIAAHGYSATTFEWDELRAFADSAKTFNVSQVLLGGHGISYEAFKKASWLDWQSSIVEEYHKLDSMGYKKIYFAGSSTGGPLLINLLAHRIYNDTIPPKGVFLIDPIIVSSNKQLTLVSVLGPILGYVTTDLSTGEQGHWYVYRPQESLKQLMSLIDMTREDLEKGITLPKGAFMKTYKSKTDETADPVSAVMIYKGMRTFDGQKTDVEIVDSKLHVFTRLKGRDNVTNADKALQMKTFKEIEKKIIEAK